MKPDLKKLWEWRLSGRIEEVRRLRASVFTQEGEIDPELPLHQELLRASLLRYDGSLDESDELLRALETAAGERTLSSEMHFLLQLQKGLNAFVRAQYAEALQLFMAARSSGISNAIFQYTAQCNMLWCLEYLGLPTSALSEEIERLESGAHGPKLTASRDQTEAFRLRVLFRERDHSVFLKLSVQELEGQAKWTWLWCRELIALRSAGDPGGDSALEQVRTQLLSDLSAEDYQRSFHLQTFLGQPGTLKGSRLKDLCDRFYLWTWRWLQDPGAVSAFELRRLRNEIAERASVETLGSEDFQQWRNALLWIGIFEGKRRDSLQDLILSRQPFHRRSDPHYEREYLLLEKLIASPYLKPVGVDEEWKSLSPDLKRRVQSRARRFHPRGISLIVDREIGQVWNLKLRRKTSSERMMRLILLLNDRPKVSRDDAIRIALDIQRIDPVAHGALWSDLLSRLRKFLPKSLSVRSRGDYLICEGSWKEILIRGQGAPVAPTSDGESKGGLRERRLKELEARTLGLFTSRDEWARPEIEESLKLSRAATNRLLDRMIRAGRIVRKGRTKSARYFLAG